MRQRNSRACTWLFTLVLVGGAPIPAVAQLKSCTPRTGAAYLVRFLAGSGAWDITAPTQSRITSKDRVDVCIEHFNHMRFALRFEVGEERSESYDYLAKLWTSILNPSIGDFLGLAAAAQPGGPPLTLLQQLQLIYARANELDRAIGAELARHPQSGLSHPQAEALAKAIELITSQQKVLTTIYADLQTFLLKAEHANDFGDVVGGTSKPYEAVTALYRTVIKRADLFLTTANRTVGIEVRKLGTKSPGTKVSVTMAAVDETGTPAAMGDLHYLVQTTWPLSVHGGLAIAKLRDVNFEKIKRAVGTSEEDLFQEKGADSTTQSLVTFLSAQVVSFGGSIAGGDPLVALLLSLGTDVRNPGKQILAGPSIAILGRVILTTGLAFGAESHGENATLEPNVFRIIRENPKTAPFLALSVKVY